MKTFNKVKLKYALPFLLLITATLLLINSCKKNLSDASTDTKVLQAKAWYEATFPQTSNTQTNLSVQSVGAKSAKTDFSQLLKPDWEHNSSYRRLNKDVIEMPVTLPSSIAFGLVNSLKSYNSTYTRSSFLILKDNTHYDAYVMVVVADSSYVKNDLTKLAHNTYRKHDSDFSGIVLYFTPKGDFLKSYGYKNGHIIKRPIQTGTQQVQSITNSSKKTNSKDDYAAGCLIYWYVTYQYGIEISRIFMFADCPTTGGPAPGGGTSDDSPCNVNTNSLNSAVKTNSYDDPGVDDPGDGGFPDPPPSQNITCFVPVTEVNPLDSILANPDNLTTDQKTQILLVLNQLKQDCLGEAIYKYMTSNNKMFSFNVASTYQQAAAYNPTNGSITIQDPATLTMAGLKEELFHAYQNFSMPGGTAQYANTANANGSITTHVSGSANIEFEAKVMLDMSTLVNGIGGFQSYTDGYNSWIYTITNGGTSFPTSFTNEQLAQYKSFMSDAINLNGSPYNGQIIDDSLLPTSMFSLINNSPCSTH